MTAREVYEAVLVEANKEQAPSFTIEEFNYLLNKSVLALTNEKYNFFSQNQQLSDDLRVLLKRATFNIDLTAEKYGNSTPTFNPIRSYVVNKVSASTTIEVSLLTDIVIGDILTFTESAVSTVTVTDVDDTAYPYTITASSAVSLEVGSPIYKRTDVITDAGLTGTTDRVVPATLISSDYLHMLSCRVYWKGAKQVQQDDANPTETQLVFPAKRLTFDMLNAIENNTYLRPAANRPYFKVQDNQMNSGISRLAGDLSAYRAYQNKPKVELHIGRQRASMSPVMVEIDYLKLPEHVVLDDIDIFTAGADTSQSLELPDYLKNEVVRRITAYLLEKMRDPRIATQPQLNQEIPGMPLDMQREQQQSQQQQRRTRNQ